MFAPLAAPQSRWKAFLGGWIIQAQVMGALLALNLLLPQSVHQARGYVVTKLVAPTDPITRAQPVNSLLHPSKPVAMEVPETPRIVMHPQLNALRKAEPDLKPPEIKVVSSTPELPKPSNVPLTKVIATNTFAISMEFIPNAAKPAAQVQTGGFGDPNGLTATGDHKHIANINSEGNPGWAMGAGFGNGLSGAKGTPGVAGKVVVQSSGFDSTAIPGRKGDTTAVVHVPATPVEIIFKPKPVYTEEARKIKVEGEVRLEVRFSADGQAHVIRVIQGLGYGLDEQAVRCAEQIKFKPAMHDGRAVDSAAVVHIVFELAS